jgi:hypothetical protein
MNERCMLFAALALAACQLPEEEDGCGGGERSRDADEGLGVAEQALSQTNTVVPIPNTTVNNFTDVSATWIKGPTSATNGEVGGTGFVAINAAPSGGSYILTSRSTNALATTPRGRRSPTRPAATRRPSGRRPRTSATGTPT